MIDKKLFEDIKNVIKEIKIFDTHEHLIYESELKEKYIDFFSFFIVYASVDLVNSGFDPKNLNILQNDSIDLEEKWKLSLNRDLRKEEALYQAYVGINEYVITSLNCSRGIARVVLDVGCRSIIEMNTNHNIFHWITILERAKGIVCVESAVSNLVEQLQIPCKKVLIKKPDGRLPVLKGDWEII